MKKSEFKAQIREEIIDILEAVDQKTLDKNLETAKELEATLSSIADKTATNEGNDSDKFQDDGYVNHTYDDSVIDKYNVPVEPTAVFEEDNTYDYEDIGSTLR